MRAHAFALKCSPAHTTAHTHAHTGTHRYALAGPHARTSACARTHCRVEQSIVSLEKLYAYYTHTHTHCRVEQSIVSLEKRGVAGSLLFTEVCDAALKLGVNAAISDGQGYNSPARSSGPLPMIPTAAETADVTVERALAI